MVKMSFNDINIELTPEELREIEKLESRPVNYDEDCPEMSAEMLSQFKRLHKNDRNKQTVSLRLSPETLNKAKLYGKGYTSFLSRLLDLAINDENMVKKCL